MPNGSDKNVVRLCGAVDGFRLRFGAWPTIAYLWPGCIDDLRHCLSSEGFANVEEKLRLIELPEESIRVADDSGRSYDYGSEGFPAGEPDIRASEWLKAERRAPTEEELRLYREQLEALQRKYPGQNVWLDPGW